jgi:hypothetical protein
MRKIVVGQFITLDGVVEIPEEWMGPYVVHSTYAKA